MHLKSAKVVKLAIIVFLQIIIAYTASCTKKEAAEKSKKEAPGPERESYVLINSKVPDYVKKYMAENKLEEKDVLIFFATTCQACMTMLEEMTENKLVKDNYAFINIDKKGEPAQETLSFLPYIPEFVPDTNKKLMRSLKIKGTPECVIIKNDVIINHIKGSSTIIDSLEKIYGS